MTFRLLRIGALILCGLIAANAAVVLGVATSTKHEAANWPGPGFRYWPERSWRSVERRLDALFSSPRVERILIATVRYSQSSLPIYGLRFPGAIAGRPPLKVLLVSGVHGTETAGVEALLRISERLARGSRIGTDADITIVPVANPWAWVYGYRYDGAGEDVNRDFASGRTQEASGLRRFMRERGPWDLFMDLHESKQGGYFIYQYLPESQGMGTEYVGILKSLGLSPADGYREGPFQVHGGMMTMPAPALAWIAMAGRLSLEQYARLLGTRHAYTVETRLADDKEERVAVHARTVEAFIERLSGGNAGR